MPINDMYERLRAPVVFFGDANARHKKTSRRDNRGPQGRNTMTSRTLRGVSTLALFFGVSGLAAAHAQQTITTTPQADQAGYSSSGVERTASSAPQATEDRVTITGSLIATTAEDAPKPVDVFTLEDLEQQGSPNVTEFVRSLTTSYGDDLGFGQASPDVPQGTGFGNANLRGLGSNGTLVLMNG